MNQVNGLKLRTKNIIFAGLSGLPLLSGCGLVSSSIDCNEQQPYFIAQEVGPLQVPEGMSAPQQRLDKRIPEIRPEAGTAIGRCLEKPPLVLSNETVLALGENRKAANARGATASIRPWPELAEDGWSSIDPLEGADLRSQLQPGLPAWRIHDLLNGWAQAWSDQESDPYFAYYAGSFMPEEGQSWSEWRNRRLARVVGEANVDVSIYGASAQVVGTDTVAVRFTERYQSDSGASVSRKEMILVREGDVWSIKREREIS